MKKWSIFGRLHKKKKSKAIARDRLKVLLVSDRIDCSPEMLEMMKNDIIKVISKYMEINEDETEIQIRQSVTIDKKTYAAAICANIPIQTVQHASL